MERTRAVGDDGGRLPAPSAELVLIGVFVGAYLKTCHLKPRERREAFLSACEDTFGLFERDFRTPRLRPISEHAALVEARAQARAWYGSVIDLLAR